MMFVFELDCYYSAKLGKILEPYKKSSPRVVLDYFLSRIFFTSELVTQADQSNTLLTHTKLGKTAHMLIAGFNTNE